jgi:hypothetical protein
MTREITLYVGRVGIEVGRIRFSGLLETVAASYRNLAATAAGHFVYIVCRA